MQKIQVGNGQCIGILFIIPVIVEIQQSQIQNLYFGIRNS